MTVMRRIVTPQYQVQEIYKKVNRTNPISGHSWTEETDFLYYQVGDILNRKIFTVKYKNKLKAAIRAVKYCRELNAYYQKFPRHILIDQKQFDKALKLGFNLTGCYCELPS